MVFLNGFDSIKENLYMLAAEDFRKRGFRSCLWTSPETGGPALAGLHSRYDTEVPAGPASITWRPVRMWTAIGSGSWDSAWAATTLRGRRF